MTPRDGTACSTGTARTPADLSYGIVEPCGLRCHYHGWPSTARAGVSRITAYPVEAKAGLLWAYLGPPPAPVVSD